MRTGLVMFEWHALGHVPLSASYTQPRRARRPADVWDWFHINSIDLEPDQNLLISSRNTWAVYQIGHTFGEVLWTLGGTAQHVRARAGRALRLAARRDAAADGSIEIFDNEDTPKIGAAVARRSTSALDFTKHTATLLHAVRRPAGRPCSRRARATCSSSPTATSFVGWGQIGLVSEFSPTAR